MYIFGKYYWFSENIILPECRFQVQVIRGLVQHRNLAKDVSDWQLFVSIFWLVQRSRWQFQYWVKCAPPKKISPKKIRLVTHRLSYGDSGKDSLPTFFRKCQITRIFLTLNCGNPLFNETINSSVTYICSSGKKNVYSKQLRLVI